MSLFSKTWIRIKNNKARSSHKSIKHMISKDSSFCWEMIWICLENELCKVVNWVVQKVAWWTRNHFFWICLLDRSLSIRSRNACFPCMSFRFAVFLISSPVPRWFIPCPYWSSFNFLPILTYGRTCLVRARIWLRICVSISFLRFLCRQTRQVLFLVRTEMCFYSLSVPDSSAFHWFKKDFFCLFAFLMSWMCVPCLS